VEVEGRRPVRAAKQTVVDPFAVKSSRIARVLLGNPQRAWQLQELAAEARVSIGLAAKVKRALLEQAFFDERDRRVHLHDPKGLLEAWEGNYRPRGERTAVYVMQKTDEAERSIAHWCAENAVHCALTGLAGAWRLAPTVRYQQTSVYVESIEYPAVVNGMVNALGAKRVDSGANLVLVDPEDPFVLYQSRAIDGISVVSPLQLYLEAAQEILKREIMPTW
jgi:hypothetical protein